MTSNLLQRLEQQLQRHWVSQETRRTWAEWNQWISAAGCEVAPPLPATLDASSKVPYQFWLEHAEPVLDAHPDWLSRLGSPAWLQRHQVQVTPQQLKEGPGSGGLDSQDLNSLQTELARLVDQIHVVQQQLRGTSPLKPSPFATAHRPASTPPPAGTVPPRTPLLSPQLLQREFQHPPESSEPKKEDAPASTEPKYATLRETYLSFNAWCDQLEELEIPLAEEIAGEVRVPSSHAISFRQFGHRLLRRAQDDQAQERLQHYLDRFEQLRQDGVDTNLSAEAQAEPAPEPEEPEKTEPPELPPVPKVGEYQSFQEWLDWLKSQEVDPQAFTQTTLESQSSHRISFPQFCRRLERQLDDVEGFRNAVAELGEALPTT